MSALLLLLLTARADFSWTKAPGAESCPDEQQVREAVAARLGYQPFESGSATRITAIVEPAAGLRGTVEVVREGRAPARRELTSATRECSELAASLELAIAIAIDPHSLARAAEPVQTAPPAPPPAPTPPPPTPDVHFSIAAG